MRTNIHALSGIRTRDLSIHISKAYASDHMATGTSSLKSDDSIRKDGRYEQYNIDSVTSHWFFIF
jgi:hypothetical protein